MKKLLLVIAMSVAVLSTGCVSNSVQTEVVDGKPSMFVRIERGLSWQIVYHKDTKVMYAVSDDSYNRGTFTLLVNPDGSPMIWGE